MKFKGVVTNTFGVVIMVTIFLYHFGIVKLPSPDFISKPIEEAIAFFVGFIMFYLEDTDFTDGAKKIKDALIGKLAK